MNFVELGALGEVIAALATVGTLGYLAVQIRLSNKLAISSIEHNLNTRVYDRRFTISRDDEFCEFLSRDWNSNELSRTEKTKIAQYVTMLIIDAREVFLQDKFGFVSEHLLSARLDVLKLGIMQNPTSKSVWASYRKLVDPDFAEYFEQEIYPGGIDEGLMINHPQYKPAKN